MPTSGRPSSRAKLDDPPVRPLLLVDPVLLDLEVDLLGAEGLDQVVDVGAGVVAPLLDQAPAEARLQAAGEGDHPLGVRGEQLHVDVRLAAREALEEAGRGELDEVGEAGVALGQQGQVVALVADLLLDRVAVVDEVGLEADDRLDPVLAAGLVEVDGAVHHAVVGEAERGLSELRGAGRHRVDLAGAVEQRVLAVGVEMDGRRRAHRSRPIMPIEADAKVTKCARSERRSPSLGDRSARVDDVGREQAARGRRRRSC